MDIEIARQDVNYTTHQIAEIRRAMQAVEAHWRTLQRERVAYELARLRLKRITEKVRHDQATLCSSSWAGMPVSPEILTASGKDGWRSPAMRRER